MQTNPVHGSTVNSATERKVSANEADLPKAYIDASSGLIHLIDEVLITER